MTTQVIDLRGRRVQLARAGTGPRLLYLHGLAFDFPWLPAHDGLARAFDVAVPVHPGFGESEGGDVDGIEDLVFHALDVLDHLGWADAHVVGSCLGGWVAAELAARHPERVRRLVLVGAAGLHVPEAPAADVFAMRPKQLAPYLFHDSGHPVARAMLAFEPTDPGALAQAVESYKAMTAAARVGWSPLLHNPRLRGLLWRITAPTLVLWGAGDRLIPPAHGEAYRDLIPAARLERIPACGHLPVVERPEETAAHVIGFLNVQEEAER